MRYCHIITRTFCNGERLYYLHGDCVHTQSFARKKNAILFAKRHKLTVIGDMSISPERNQTQMESV